MPPWGHSDMEALRYTEEELNAMCEKAASDYEKQKCREYNLREAEYYDKRAQLDAKQDKVVKWQLPVEIDGVSGEYYVQFPDDLMEASGIKENDVVEWVDKGDGSYLLRKVTKPIGMEEC
jgi:predicted nuclease of restriction endonuclease-like RecB superfamily